MSNKDSGKMVFKIVTSIFIIIIESIIYWAWWNSYFNLVVAFPFWKRGIWLMVALYSIILLMFLKLYGGLKIGYLKKGNLIYSHLLSLIFTNIITYFQIALIDRRFQSLIPIVLMTIFQSVVIVAWALITYYTYCKLYPPRRLILVYGKRSVFNLMEKIKDRSDKYKICETIDIGLGIDLVRAKIELYDGVIIGDLPAGIRNDILKYCYEKSIRSYTIPKISDILLRNSDVLTLFDTPLLLNRNQILPIERRIWKRLVDIVVSIIGLILLWPVLFLCMIAIKLYDGGPVFYKQERLTLNGSIFQIYKFRSMIINAESNGTPRLARKGDERITPIGRILRTTRLDELPQLFNIIKGDMSVVGPRPERPEIAAIYENEIPEFKFRLKVKAGLTGYAQIYGKYNTSPYDKLKLDMMYIEKLSLLLDLKLILMTPKILFMKESTEGIMGNTDKYFERVKNIEEDNRIFKE